MFKTSKRLIAMLVCLAMVLTMLPMTVFAAGTTIKLYCATSWANCNVYAWNGSGNNGNWPGVAMTKGDDGIWYAEVDASFTNVIFNNGSGAQTSDLAMPTDENVQFTVGGTWGPYSADVEIPEIEYITVYCSTSWSTCNAYWWGSSDSNPGWPGEAMTEVKDGVWSISIPSDAGNIIFNNGSGVQTGDLKMPTTENAMYKVASEEWGVFTTECTHENVTDLPAVSATCISAGKTAGSVCADCGESLVAQEDVAALGHIGAEGETCERCGNALNYITVYFQNNWMWTEVSAHYWGSAIEADTAWPGKALEVYGNDGTYDVYAVKVPADIEGLIFNGQDATTTVLNQSPDIKDAADGNCYYMVWNAETEMNDVGFEDIEVILPPEPVCEHEYFYACDAYCMHCGELTNEAAAHSIQHMEAVEAPCGGTGNIEYWYCEYCNTCWDNAEGTGMPLNKKNVITFKDHAIVAVEAVDATCDAPGNVAYWYCSDCETVWADEALTQITNFKNVVTPISHSIIHVELTDATCYEEGNIEYWYCEDCGSAWTDELLREVTNLKNVITPAAHAEATHVEAVEATCYEEGNIEYWYCEACGQAWLDADCTLNTNLKAVVTPAAHAEATHVEAVEATCYEEGNIEYWYCEACGQAWLDADCTLNTNLKAVVTPAAHAEATHVEAVEATCYEEGNIEYWYCEACGQAWLDADCTMNTNLKAVVLPMAHAEATHVEAVEATCYEEGNIEYWYCEACGQAWLDADCTLNTNLKAVVTPAAHAEATHVAAKDATCQENGNIEYWYCEACGQTWLDADCTLNTNLKSVVTVGDHNYQGNVCTECGDCEYDVMFQSKTVDGVSYIRLVTYVDDLSNYSNVCFNVTVNGNTTSWNCEVAYSYLIAGYVAKIPNEVFGEDAEYFVLYTFGNAQNYAEYDMTVSVTWTAVDGTQVTSESRTVNVGELLAN